MSGESKLPMAQQERRARMEREASDPSVVPPTEPTGEVIEPKVVTLPTRPEPTQIGDPAPPVPPTEPTPPAPSTPSAREQALEEELRRMRQSQELLQLELAEARAQPLTAAPDPAKASPMGEAPSPVAAVLSPLNEVGDTSFTPQEQEDFSEAEPAITKVARREITALIKKPLEAIVARLEALEHSHNTTSQTVSRVATEGFVGQVREKVPEFDTLVTHAQWPTFLNNTIPLSGGVKFKDALSKAHFERRLPDVVDIFEAFKKHIGAGTPADTSGYASTAVSGGIEAPVSQPAPTKLKMSVRRKAGEDFIKGRITRAELDSVVNDFREAEKHGLIDYDN